MLAIGCSFPCLSFHQSFFSLGHLGGPGEGSGGCESAIQVHLPVAVILTEIEQKQQGWNVTGHSASQNSLVF